MKRQEYIKINKKDVINACTILENLRVSLDQIGGYYADNHDKRLQALDQYFNPRLYQKIVKGWKGLKKYIDNTEEIQRSKGIGYFKR